MRNKKRKWPFFLDHKAFPPASSVLFLFYYNLDNIPLILNKPE